MMVLIVQLEHYGTMNAITYKIIVASTRLTTVGFFFFLTDTGIESLYVIDNLKNNAFSLYNPNTMEYYSLLRRRRRESDMSQVYSQNMVYSQ
jgi:hypothetical protein